MDADYRICTRCIMDTSDPDIEFDKNGFCNHCRSYFEYVQAIGETKEYAINKLTEIVETIKRKRGGERIRQHTRNQRRYRQFVYCLFCEEIGIETAARSFR